MVAVIQRVAAANVAIDGVVISQIDKGLVVLVGITASDGDEDSSWLAQKIMQMRIFHDEYNKINLSVQEVAGSLLVISQFTLMASTKKGNRPSFLDAAKTEYALPLYNKFITDLISSGANVKTGKFGANMQVQLVNEGPFTILVDTKNKK